MRYFPTTASAAIIRLFARSLALAGVGLALAAAQPAQAQQASPVTLSSPDPESIRVRIDNATGQPGRVQVVSLNTGRVLFHETYAGPAYGHRFNFRALPAGRYRLLLQAAGTEYRYTVQVQPGSTGQAVVVRQQKTRGAQLLLADAK
ncbi:carboxypeptidase-like regulatory domain-containing protein [Hymenobacter pini]|uniref:carboxypeptidase-like regulatory domain-containing protein n=1 Tax=Hymenobacter pini TaxID=2880879 RepID=UPI001CF55445|nr:carboxypeptidase-like regulatory domain-containing protein [Hymenobacter pini]MCA8832466.1 carboxypeptidase-like regulatory domain-containing protein [Hymenobacter pini]